MVATILVPRTGATVTQAAGMEMVMVIPVQGLPPVLGRPLLPLSALV